MNCTAKEFEDKIWAVFPQATLYGALDDSNAYCVYHFLPEESQTLINAWGPIEKEVKASHIWRSGCVYKDRTGLFTSVLLVGGGSCGQSSFSANVVLAGPSQPAYTPPTFRPLLPSMLPDYDKQKAVLKCECGAHSVGSNKHSNWCSIKEGA